MEARTLSKLTAGCAALLLAAACDVEFIAGPDVVRNGESVLYQVLVQPPYQGSAANATVYLTGDIPDGWMIEGAKFQASMGGGVGGDLTVYPSDPGIITDLPPVPAGHQRIYLSGGPFAAITDADRGTALLGFAASSNAGDYTITFWAGVSSQPGEPGASRSKSVRVMAPDPPGTILADGFELGTAAGWSARQGVDASAVAFLPLDGTADDASAYGNDGIISGAPTPVEDRFGTPAAALRFDGLEDRIIIPYHPSLDLEEALTLSAWVRPAPTGSHYIVGKDNPYGGGFVYSLDYLTSAASGRLRDAQGAGAHASGYIPLLADEWQLLVFTFDGDDLVCFVDGVLEGHLERPGTIIGTGEGDVQIGSFEDARYRGVMDDILIMNRALSYREVVQMVY